MYILVTHVLFRGSQSWPFWGDNISSLVESDLIKTCTPLPENSFNCDKHFFLCTPATALLLGCLCSPVIKWAFGRRCQKVVSRGREDMRVWYRETMFSQMVSYDFLLHGYFLYLVCASPEKPTRRCEPEEGYLRCSK